MPGSAAPVCGFFHPAPAFAELGAPLIALAQAIDAQAQSGVKLVPPASELTGLSPEDRGHQVYHALRENPAVMRLVGLWDEVAALGLELRDEAGVSVPVGRVCLARVSPGLVAAGRAETEDLGLEPSEYILLNQPASGAT